MVFFSVVHLWKQNDFWKIWKRRTRANFFVHCSSFSLDLIPHQVKLLLEWIDYFLLWERLFSKDRFNLDLFTNRNRKQTRVACDIFLHFVASWFQSTINIVFDRVGRVDPVTRGLEIGTFLLNYRLISSANFTFMNALLVIDCFLSWRYFDQLGCLRKRFESRLFCLYFNEKNK